MMALIPAAGQVTRHSWLPSDGTDSLNTWPALTEVLNEEMPNKVSFCTAHFLWICGLLGFLLPKARVCKAQAQSDLHVQQDSMAYDLCRAMTSSWKRQIMSTSSNTSWRMCSCANNNERRSRPAALMCKSHLHHIDIHNSRCTLLSDHYLDLGQTGLKPFCLLSWKCKHHMADQAYQGDNAD